MEKREINEIVEKMKAEIRQGLAERKMDITGVSMAMTAAFDDIRTAIISEVEKIAGEEQNTQDSNCPDCGRPLKKTAKPRKKKTS